MSSNATEGSTRAILYALGANGGIALSKFVAAAYSGSGALLAEGIHSSADCANQLLLLVGMKGAQAGESDEHPMGTQRVTYFYSMLVALLPIAQKVYNFELPIIGGPNWCCWRNLFSSSTRSHRLRSCTQSW